MEYLMTATLRHLAVVAKIADDGLQDAFTVFFTLR